MNKYILDPIEDEREQFLNWYDDFSNDNDACFIAPASWFDRSIKNHRELVDFLDGPNISFEIDLKPNEDEPVDSRLIENEAYSMFVTIPEYFTHYGLSYFDLARPSYVSKLTGKKMSWGKSMSNWMDKNKVSPDRQKLVNQLLSKIGNTIAKNKTTDSKLFVHLMTSPIAFASIGHYGVDDDSCFRSGHINEIHKFIIGQTSNSFIGIVSNEMFSETGDVPESIKMRFWGIASDDFSTFNICNIYPRHPDQQGNVYKSVKLAFAELLGKDIVETPLRWRATGVFFNKESALSYHHKSINLGEKTEIYPMNDDGLKKYRYCIRCSQRVQGEDDLLEQIDYNLYCKKCASHSYEICDYSGQKTMLERLPVTYKGKEILISEIAEREFFRECKDGVFRHLDEIVKVEGGYEPIKGEQVSHPQQPDWVVTWS